MNVDHAACVFESEYIQWKSEFLVIGSIIFFLESVVRIGTSENLISWSVVETS